jgi:ubiquinone biosynthesis protein COQ9
MSDTRTTQEIRDALLAAALSHVAFDGWGPATFIAACEDANVDPGLAETIFPRRHVDLAVAFHKLGDAAMVMRIESEDLSAMKFREKVAFAVRARLEVTPDKEAVRRGSSLFALPQNGPDGAKLVWETADLIWTTLGDTSDDINWYTKRATLSAVYGSTVLYWLGDQSEENTATWEFLDRRISDVMKIEEIKAAARKNPLLKAAFAGPNWVLGQVKAPRNETRSDLPGSINPK